ncbi:MAG TPA: hypothetical protein VMT38_01280 [Terracidiphilus sp.]|nr:hypothetical protein [Terracidiphilus sp.]
MDRYVFPTIPRTAEGAGKIDRLIRIVKADGQFQLSVDDGVVASEPSALKLVPELIRALDEMVLLKMKSMHAVHAGAVLWKGKALVLPGGTHSGKSSLVAELLRQGATYFSDEYALIDSGGRAHPYPRPLLLRNGQPLQVPVLAEECEAEVGAKSAPVCCIFFINYEPTGSWNVMPLHQSLALLSLLRNTPHTLDARPDMMAAFQCAVAGARSFAGIRGDAVDAAKQILRLADSDS